MVMVDGFWEDLLEDVSEAASEVAVGDGNASEPRAGIVWALTVVSARVSTDWLDVELELKLTLKMVDADLWGKY
jgi:hypothetical protein